MSLTAKSVDDYIAQFPPETQRRLRRVREIIRETAPAEATETISYRMPTFDLNGKHFAHFAGFEHHIGLYPLPHAMETFAEELAAYKTGKGSVQFPLDQPLPEDLIRRIIEFKVAENISKSGK